ncbi:MAG TPA: ferredoxin--NADP reductase [Acidimicrobiia bacterium]
MGQVISVKPAKVGNVAIFTLDRSLTGQDPRVFDTAPPEEGDAVDRMARRILSDPRVTSVHVLSNVVTVSRQDEWEVGALNAARDTIATMFVHYGAQDPEELRAAHYNATITHIRAHNPDLWILKIRPDEPPQGFQPGQYTTLGLGYWEPRSDEAPEEFDPKRHDKMALRSYSVSSSIIDEAGNLVPAQQHEVEFYIVKVRPGQIEIPALTPRLFLKTVGDRIYMGRKFAGRYTLEGVEPDDNVVFLSTGTGEAPQNAMTAELLRRGHRGRILNVVCVRYLQDLGYAHIHPAVAERWPNYRYHLFATREPADGKKVYIQDLILDGTIEDLLGAPLSPDTTHVFLCGNPAMIGLPKWEEDGSLTFPKTLGVAQILTERGFTLDHRRDKGNVHYEEFWTERAVEEA